MASNECMYFYEDEVYRVTKKGNLEFGMVLQNADVDTDEEQSDSEEVEKLKNGHILVAWHPRGEEDVVNEKKVGLSDRCLMPGDVVRRLVPGQDTQRGYCRSITMKATVQVMGTRQVIYSVPSEELTPLEEFAPDIAVCMDAWVGIINSVTSDVSVQFVDGSVCVLTDEEAAELDDPAGGRLTDSGFRLWFYPGQKLQGPMRMFEPGRWTTCNTDAQALREKRNKHVKVTVTRYSVTSLSVHWQCRAATVEGSLDQPPYVVSGDDLKRVRMLNVFEPCTLQLGDMNTYRLRDTEILMSVDEWKRLEKDTLKTGRRTVRPAAKATRAGGAAAAAALPNGVADDDMGSVSSYSSVGSAGKRTRRGPSLKTHIMKKRKLKRSRPCRHPVYESRSFSAGDTLVVETMKTASWVTVVWQDGTVEEDIPSTSLYPSHHLDEHEFFPGDYVVEQKTEASPSEYGVIQRVDHAGRTSLVSWYRTYMLGGQSSPQLLRRSEASVYDLSDHPDFRYRPGTVVISVSAGAAGEPTVGGSTGAAETVVGGSTDAESATTNSTGVVMAEQGCKIAEGTSLETDEVGGKAEKRTGETADNEKSEIAKVTESAEVPGRGDGDKEERSEPTQTAAASESAPSGCAHAGQVLDVLTSGEVKVWWADGSSSNCYPQDLFRVGEYDSDEGELWDNGAESQSTESAEWETQSEESMAAGDVSSDQEPVLDDRLKPKLAATIDKIRVLMTRLEQIFTQYSTVQSPFVMKQLLNIYKNSRCLDKLMDTAFFQESHFGGLVNQIRERSKAFAAQLGGAARLTDAGAPGGDSQNQDGASATAATDDGPAMNECGQLCAKIKSQLLLAHEEVVRRYGIPLDTGLSYGSPAGEDSGINGDVRTDGEGNEEIDDDPTSPDEVKVTPSVDDAAGSTETRGQEMFTTLPEAPECHKFHNSPFQPVESPVFLKAVRREIKLLNKALPEGIIVKGFDDRMDLYSVMIKGPRRTPYEDGLFFFEIQLSPDYPRTPPMFHYISYCQDRLNPNLYEDGKVCVSLLGTWGGRGSEVWSAASSLMQVLVSIQGLILASEPYYNEAGYEKQRGSQQGAENSRLYNEMVILKLVQSLTAIMRNPPSVFVAEACEHLKTRASSLIARLRHWLQASEAATQPATQANAQANAQAATQTATQADTQTDTLPVEGETKPEFDRPDFPLIPASRGFGIALKKTLRTFEQTLAEHGVCEPAGGSLPAPSGTLSS